MNFRLASSLLIVSALTACADSYTVSTNLDKENFVEYFKPGQVTIIEREQLEKYNYLEIGVVEGEACQEKAHYAEPTDVEARTDARRKAADMGANAIVFQQCMMTEPSNDSCYKVKLCYGRAIKVTNPDKE